MRGRREGMLDVTLRLDTEPEKPKWDAPHNPCESRIAARFGIKGAGPPGRQMAARHRALDLAREELHVHRDRTDGRCCAKRRRREAINVFARNLKDLLLAAPAGPRATMGLDPGLRTGVKVAVVDADRQGGRHRHHLPARAAQRLGRFAAHAGQAGARSTMCR